MQIEGKNPVKEGLAGQLNITRLYIARSNHDCQDIISAANERKIKVEMIDRGELDKMSLTGKHQGVIAIANEFQYSELEEIISAARDKGENLLIIVLDGIEDPHNLGSIIRVAECAGAHGIVIPSHRAVAVNETVLRVSAGAASHIKIAKVTNINDAIRKLTNEFVNVLCADMDGQSMLDMRYDGDIALVIGAEGSGVKPLTRKLCDKSVSIPQFGKVNSLNASVACGILLYSVISYRAR